MYSDYRRLMAPWPEQRLITAAAETRPMLAADALNRDMADAFERAQGQLSQELLGLIHAQGPTFFEELIIDVLLAAGYGARRRDLAARLGRTGDGGVDGVIAQDVLGLELIYVQAKRLKPGTTVPVSDIRDFVGSLDAHRAGKGIFVTTSHFSESAVQFCKMVSRRVVLIDGPRFAELMIRYNIGVKVRQSYQFKRVDLDYFSPAGAARHGDAARPAAAPIGF